MGKLLVATIETMAFTTMSCKPDQQSFLGKLPPKRVRNSEVRSREHLLPDEVDKLIQAAKGVGRHGCRDATLILLAYRHGLRASELVALKWEQINYTTGTIHINRSKRGLPSTHPLRGVELRMLRQLEREYPSELYLFLTERKAPITTATVRKIVARAGELAAIPFPVHLHMLRHACGYYLASKGQDTRAIQAYLGHKTIQHTVRYTELAPNRFKDFWDD